MVILLVLLPLTPPSFPNGGTGGPELACETHHSNKSLTPEGPLRWLKILYTPVTAVQRTTLITSRRATQILVQAPVMGRNSQMVLHSSITRNMRFAG